MSGEKRKYILDHCPEEFEFLLKEFIDEVENEVNEALSCFEITSVSDLSKIEEGCDKLAKLSEDLY